MSGARNSGEGEIRIITSLVEALRTGTVYGMDVYDVLVALDDWVKGGKHQCAGCNCKFTEQERPDAFGLVTGFADPDPTMVFPFCEPCAVKGDLFATVRARLMKLQPDIAITFIAFDAFGRHVGEFPTLAKAIGANSEHFKLPTKGDQA